LAMFQLLFIVRIYLVWDYPLWTSHSVELKSRTATGATWHRTDNRRARARVCACVCLFIWMTIEENLAKCDHLVVQFISAHKTIRSKETHRQTERIIIIVHDSQK
jgi:hypothetical protein